MSSLRAVKRGTEGSSDRGTKGSTDGGMEGVRRKHPLSFSCGACSAYGSASGAKGQKASSDCEIGDRRLSRTGVNESSNVPAGEAEVSEGYRLVFRLALSGKLVENRFHSVKSRILVLPGDGLGYGSRAGLFEPHHTRKVLDDIDTPPMLSRATAVSRWRRVADPGRSNTRGVH